MQHIALVPSLLRTQKRVLVKQIKEWGEIFTGFETRNRFDVADENGKVFLHAAEEGGGIGAFFLRSFLGPMRAAKVHLVLSEVASKTVARGEKPFRFYFHRMEAYDGARNVGAIQRRFSILHRIFTVFDAEGRERFTIRSPLFRIWTFKVLNGEREVAMISKRWAGLLKEAFTDADVFGVEYEDAALTEDDRFLLLIATFLIDFTCFENNNKR